jgi:hypothetical protein
VTADYLIRVVLADGLAVAFAGGITYLLAPLARDWWKRQTEAAAEQITVLQTIPLTPRGQLTPRGRHSRRHFKAVS